MKIEVLHVGARIGIGGGIEKYFMGIYNSIDKNKYQLDVAVTDEGKPQYFEKELIKNGSMIYYLPRRDSNLLKSITCRFTTYSKYKGKIIHIHVSRGMRAFDGIIAKLCGAKKIVYHSHTDFGKPNLKHKLASVLFRISGDYFIGCTSHAGQYFFGDDIINKSNFSVQKNAIDCSKYIFDENKRKAVRNVLHLDNVLTLGFIGRLAYEKNVCFIIEILYEILNMGIQTKLIIVGDGPDYENVVEKIKLLGLQDYVILTGLKEDVSWYMCAIDALILPSQFEGLGISLIEAQTAGTRCFASDKVPEESNVAGLVTYISLNKSAEYWAKQIVSVHGLPCPNDSFQKVIESGYNISEAIKKIENIYDMLSV